MKEYCIRRTGRQRYEIAVFTWHAAPDVIYVISHGSCNCPAMGHCKHLDMFHLFQQLREPWLATFWYEQEKWKWKVIT